MILKRIPECHVVTHMYHLNVLYTFPGVVVWFVGMYLVIAPSQKDSPK